MGTYANYQQAGTVARANSSHVAAEDLVAVVERYDSVQEGEDAKLLKKLGRAVSAYCVENPQTDPPVAVFSFEDASFLGGTDFTLRFERDMPISGKTDGSAMLGFARAVLELAVETEARGENMVEYVDSQLEQAYLCAAQGEEPEELTNRLVGSYRPGFDRSPGYYWNEHVIQAQLVNQLVD
jgi:hypothetical protein